MTVTSGLTDLNSASSTIPSSSPKGSFAITISGPLRSYPCPRLPIQFDADVQCVKKCTRELVRLAWRQLAIH